MAILSPNFIAGALIGSVSHGLQTDAEQQQQPQQPIGDEQPPAAEAETPQNVTGGEDQKATDEEPVREEDKAKVGYWLRAHLGHGWVWEWLELGCDWEG